MIAYMGQLTATEITNPDQEIQEIMAANAREDGFNWENFTEGLSNIAQALNPFAESVLKAASAKGQQEREYEYQTALAKIKAQMPQPMADFVSSPALPITAIAIVAAIIISKKRRKK